MTKTYIPETGGQMIEGRHFEQTHSKCYIPKNKGAQGERCSRNKMCNETGGDQCLRYMVKVDNVDTEWEAKCGDKKLCNTTQIVDNMSASVACPKDNGGVKLAAIAIVFAAISFYLAV